MLRYTPDHEWLRPEGDLVTVGITAHAAEQLGDLVFIELPEIGREVTQGEEIVVIESVKAASDIRAPVDGTIVEANQAVVEDPSLGNSDPTGAGWFFRIRPAEGATIEGYMDEAAYRETIEAEG